MYQVMSVIKKPRTLESYKKKKAKTALNSQKIFVNSLKNFNKFSLSEYDKPADELIQEMKVAEEEAVFDILQEWVNWSELSPSSIALYFVHIRSYLYYRGIKLSSQDVKESIDFPKIHQEELHPLSNEEFNKILDFASNKNKVFYLCLSSSALRPIELCSIRKSDLELDKKRIIVHVPAKYTKLKRAKVTFFSNETAKKLRLLIKNLGDNDLIFGGTTKARDLVFAKLLKRAGLHKTNDKGYSIINLMGFRSWFISKISRHDYNLAKKWAGQKGYMLQYDRMTIEEQLEKYIEFEFDLIVSNDERNKIKLERQQKRIDEADMLRKELNDFKKQIKNEVDSMESCYKKGQIFTFEPSNFRN